MNLNEALKELKKAGFLIEDAYPKEYGIKDIIKIAKAHGWSAEYVYKRMTEHLKAYSIIGKVESLFEKNKEKFEDIESVNVNCTGEDDNDFTSISIDVIGKETGYYIEGFIVFDNDDFTSGRIVWDLHPDEYGGPGKQDIKKFSNLTDNVILELLNNLNEYVTNY